MSVAVLAAAGMLASAPPVTAHPSVLSPQQVRHMEWWVGRLDLDHVWRITRGAGVTVAVLDTGVNGGFADLRGALVPGFVPNGTGDGLRDTDPAHHGTIIADEIAGRGTGFGLLGVAPRAKIMSIQTGGQQQLLATDPTVIALNRLAAMAHPPQVANMSYGTAGRCPANVQQAVLRAARRGIILVAAAGNTASYFNKANYPADCRGVVAVGAVDVNGRTWSDSQREPYVSLAGPGVHMVSYDTAAASGYGYATGSSDAAAIVSGIFALVRARFPNASADEVVTRVFATARQFVGKPGVRNDQQGFGVARPYDALTAAPSPTFPNPVYAAISRIDGTPRDAHSSGLASGSGSAPSSKPGRTGRPAQKPASQPASSSGLGAGALVGIVVAVIVLAALAIGLVMRARRRRAVG
jgi:subtilisin family serine protease